ncbi:hypothetical protein M4J06_003789 [Streptomyces coelicoflavus]|uniref:hypothetical protein n=1 Tax=Streptomyces coelicoflavus TaxID=285562 RepID=UPI00210A361D|nr:hypothetical protein [Streptomyces coelicoflavus]MCQ4200311.1 hypothetical protein [Streptomyces coelicoflavus]
MLTARPHNREQLGRDRLDLVLLHNPEHAHLAPAPPRTARSSTHPPTRRKPLRPVT